MHGNGEPQGGHLHQSGNRYDQSSQAGGPGSFGVRVQVQGIQGRPYVVLNGQGRPSQPPAYPDVFYMDQPHQQYVSTMNGRGSSISSPLMDHRPIRQIQTASPEVSVSAKNPGSPLLNYQRHPELLQPYDPSSNSLELQGFHHRSMADSDLNQGSTNSPPVYASHVMVKRARIPVPGTGRKRPQEKDQLDSGAPAAESVPCRPSHIVCRLSVPDTSYDHRWSSQRMGRARHRNQISFEEKRRSRSVEASSSGDSFRTSPVSAGVEAGAAPVSARKDTLRRQKTEESIYEADIRSLTAAQFEEQQKEMLKPSSSGRVTSRLDRKNLCKSFQQSGEPSSPEREAQVTYCLL